MIFGSVLTTSAIDSSLLAALSKNIQLPDIGDFDEVEVIEILVSVGDTIEAEDSIITLESDKASMEIPAPWAGVVHFWVVMVRVKPQLLVLFVAC
jgi:biotin carboxyl carrier protein